MAVLPGSAYFNVVNFYGGSETIGQIDAQIMMATNYGHVMNISGNLINCGSGSSESNVWIYASDVQVNLTEATNWGYPTSSGSVPFNRHYSLPSASGSIFSAALCTGTSYSNGNSVSTFGRGDNSI